MSESVVTLDVREHLNSGREPFSAIMQAVSRLIPGEKLLLVAPFEPVPLYGVMAQRGFDHQTNQRENGDWDILFSPIAKTEPLSGDAPACGRTPRPGVIEIDARGLEPPEPMVRILEAVTNLPVGGEARAYTDRRPVHLYTQLEERGLVGESQEQADGSYVTFIHRR